VLYKSEEDIRPEKYFGKYFDEAGTHAWIGECGLFNNEKDFLVPRKDLYLADYGYAIYDVKSGEILRFCKLNESDQEFCQAYNKSVRDNTECPIAEGQVFYPSLLSQKMMIGQNIHAYPNNLSVNSVQSEPVPGAWEYIKRLIG
jgi:hypothetical protein